MRAKEREFWLERVKAARVELQQAVQIVSGLRGYLDPTRQLKALQLRRHLIEMRRHLQGAAGRYYRLLNEIEEGNS